MAVEELVELELELELELLLVLVPVLVLVLVLVLVEMNQPLEFWCLTPNLDSLLAESEL